jgi:hypothetical protein
MFQNNSNNKFVLIKINVMASLEMQNKDTYFACWQAANLCSGTMIT